MLNRFTLGLSPTKKKIFANIFWAMLDKIVTTLGVLFVGILGARYLGLAQFVFHFRRFL